MLKWTWWLFAGSAMGLLTWCKERREIVQDEISEKVPANNFNLHHTPARVTFSYTDDGIKTKHHPAKYMVRLDVSWVNIRMNNREIYQYIESKQWEWELVPMYIEVIWTEYFKTDAEWSETLLETRDATSHKVTFSDLDKTFKM